jgi:inorganic triphosphatase YgiF
VFKQYIETEAKYFKNEALFNTFIKFSDSILSTKKCISTYFDNDNLDLFKLGYLLRLKQENEKNILTLKWPIRTGDMIKDIYRRGEFEVSLDIKIINPKNWKQNLIKHKDFLEVVPSEFIRIMNENNLRSYWQAKYVRQNVLIETNNILINCSLDEGIFVFNNYSLNQKFNEMEIELKEGNEEHFFNLCHNLEDKYKLIPCIFSKYERIQFYNKLLEEHDKSDLKNIFENLELFTKN